MPSHPYETVAKASPNSYGNRVFVIMAWIILAMMGIIVVIAYDRLLLESPVDIRTSKSESDERYQEEEGITILGKNLLIGQRRIQAKSDNDDAIPNDIWAYSKYATIVPDPEYHGTEEEKEKIKQEWGGWHFWDGAEDERPSGDYCAAYPYRDVPDEDFAEETWQADAVFVNHMLDSAAVHIERVQNAIYVEYGYTKNPPVKELLERNKMFRWEKIDMSDPAAKPSSDSLVRGGWTSHRSVSGLTRRLLHAIMTNDEFVVIVVGGAAAAGDGNHFRQSYSMQFHRVVAPVLARLGVKLVTRNLSHRHAGSLVTGLGKTWGGGGGNGIDLLIWDAGHFEHARREKDLFLRQVLLSGVEKIPAVWMGGPESDFDLLRFYHEQADIDVGRFGTGMYGIKPVTDEAMVDSLPHPVRYLKCAENVMKLCRNPPDNYCAKCWIDRSDIPDPKVLFPNITTRVPDQMSWNPGWRQHQLTGRLIAYAILDALQDAVQLFTSGTLSGPPLESSQWHMREYYENQREKLANLVSSNKSGCSGWGDLLPSRVCSIPLRGATQYTPRAGPSITDIIKAGSPDKKPVNTEKVMYEGFDEHNSCFDPADGDINIVGVSSSRRLLGEQELALEDADLLRQMPPPAARVHAARIANNKNHLQSLQSRRSQQSSRSLETGSWRVADELPGTCDGAYTSYNCGRQSSSICPLLGHHDSRGQVQGDESSGWLVLELEKLQKGLIILAIHLTTSSSTVGRRLGRNNPSGSLPASFAMDVSIDGTVTTWNKEEFSKNFRGQLQRGFDALVLMDDETFTTTSEVVEVGLRLRGCGSQCTLGVTHVFWA